MPNIGLLINPYAKKFLVQPHLIRQLKDKFPGKKSVWQPTTLSELAKCSQSILQTKIDYLFILGGDGTFRTTVGELVRNRGKRTLPVFIPLQGGTANLYSKQFYGKRNPIHHIQASLQKINGEKNPKNESINILKINEQYGFIFAIGGISNFIQYYLTYLRRSMALGVWIACKVIISAMFKTKFSSRLFKPFDIDLGLNNYAAHTINCTSLSCSTIPGYILKPYIDIVTNKNFSVLIFKKFPWDLFFEMASMMAQKRMQSPTITQTNASSVSIFSSVPLQPMVDGDMLAATNRINIELGPEIKILQL